MCRSASGYRLAGSTPTGRSGRGGGEGAQGGDTESAPTRVPRSGGPGRGAKGCTAAASAPPPRPGVPPRSRGSRRRRRDADRVCRVPHGVQQGAPGRDRGRRTLRARLDRRGPRPDARGRREEEAPLRPSDPYAASKAASDLIALSYHRTYGVPVCVTRSSNNYGPYQHPEKIVPLFLTRLLTGGTVTLHGRGEHVRNWLHVEDNCAGIERVLRDGTPGEVYHLGGGTDLSSRGLTGRILAICGAAWDSVEYVQDRPANDIRYSIDWSKAAGERGYRPERDFEEGLAATADWYRRDTDRWAPLTSTLRTARLARPLPAATVGR
ncbi:dTDP-glucose 4,6-dehydratase [Streptomyces marincola]|uniref:dTDP-glucose 4,6-dehydratase n=1 Tax=Streptomyces marincola TaxID=2878388 RepID=UPI00384FC2A9